jgi:hypothetical protein
MKRIMISNGLRGKENPKEYVERCRQVVRDHYAFFEPNECVELIDTYFGNFNGNRLQFLGKSISEGLALANEVVFMDDWEKYDGCRSEHFIASQYSVKCVYLRT